MYIPDDLRKLIEAQMAKEHPQAYQELENMRQEIRCNKEQLQRLDEEIRRNDEKIQRLEDLCKSHGITPTF